MEISGIILTGNMQEQILYDDPEVRCALYSVDYDRYSRSQVPWHWHDEIELLRVLSGSCLYRTGAGDVKLSAGDAVFLPPGALHCLIPMEKRTLSHAILFTKEFLCGGENRFLEERYIAPLLKRMGGRCIRIEKGESVLARMEEAEKLGAEKPFFYEPRLISSLWEIWKALLDRTNGLNAGDGDGRGAEQENERVKKMLLFIENHFAEPVSVADLARSANVSERECYRLFAGELHESPAQFLLDYRIRRGGELLLAGDLPVTGRGSG